MKIIRKDEANYVEKPGGPNVRYYLFDEYEMHYNEQPPHSTQDWHHHDRVWETVLVLEGEMTALWKEGEEVHESKVAGRRCRGDWPIRPYL